MIMREIDDSITYLERCLGIYITVYAYQDLILFIVICYTALWISYRIYTEKKKVY